jgi:hypothetical protein
MKKIPKQEPLDPSGTDPNLKQAFPHTYSVWVDMWARCTDPEHPCYPEEGAKGIRVHEPWRRFATFIKDAGVSPDDRRQPFMSTFDDILQTKDREIARLRERAALLESLLYEALANGYINGQEASSRWMKEAREATKR